MYLQTNKIEIGRKKIDSSWLFHTPLDIRIFITILDFIRLLLLLFIYFFSFSFSAFLLSTFTLSFYTYKPESYFCWLYHIYLLIYSLYFIHLHLTDRHWLLVDMSSQWMKPIIYNKNVLYDSWQNERQSNWRKENMCYLYIT